MCVCVCLYRQQQHVTLSHMTGQELVTEQHLKKKQKNLPASDLNFLECVSTCARVRNCVFMALSCQLHHYFTACNPRSSRLDNVNNTLLLVTLAIFTHTTRTHTLACTHTH